MYDNTFEQALIWLLTNSTFTLVTIGLITTIAILFGLTHILKKWGEGY